MSLNIFGESFQALARGLTGRSRVVKFGGCYHGASDSLLAESGSGVAQHSLPGTVAENGGSGDHENTVSLVEKNEIDCW